MKAELKKVYQPSWIVELLHSIPHFDLTFQPVNATFNLDDNRYRESLLVWAAVPVLWLLITLLLFLIYFCYRCCRRDVTHRQKMSCLKWSMGIFVLFSCASLGVGFYGNEVIKKESAHVMALANNSVDVLARIQQQLRKLEASINETVASGTNAITAVYNVHPKLVPGLRHDLVRQTRHSFMFAEEVLGFYYKTAAMQWISNADSKGMMKLIREYAQYRWLVTTVFLCWLTVLCLILLLGISKLSKCTLLMFCTFGIFSLVKCWIAAGLHLGVVVGMADYCDSPYTAIEDIGSNYMERGVINYYAQCTSVDPFKTALEAAMNKVTEANETLNRALEVAHRHVQQTELDSAVQRVYTGLNDATDCIGQLGELSQCTDPSRDYATAVDIVCNSILNGMVLLTLSFAATGLLFSLLVVMASRAWRSTRTREVEETYPKPHDQSEEDEGPFLPRPSAPVAPSYYRYGAPAAEYGRPGSVQDDYNMPYARGNIQVQMAMQRQASPAPPPYSTNDFYRQYNETVNPAAMYGRCGHPAS